MMGFFDTDRWGEIWQTIARNRRRSVMTALGVFWGIFMLIVLLGVGTGMGRMFRAQLGGTSTNTVFFMSDQTSIPYKGMPKGRYWNLNMDDVAAMLKLPSVQYVSAISWGNSVTCRYENKKGDYQLMGYSPDYQKINAQDIFLGRFLNDVDAMRGRKVCVIGVQVWRDLFPGGENPEGKTILVNNTYYTVVGVSKPLGKMMMFSDPERTVSIPITVLNQVYGRGRNVNLLAVAAHHNVDSKQLIEEGHQIIATPHLISPDDKKAIMTMDTSEVFGKVMGLFRGISLLTWIVGLGTLLAGVVGISNIMLVVVRERTQEIGIRRAIGASPRVILTQILSESFVLTFIAGVAGLALGVGTLSLGDSFYQRALLSSENLPDISWQISFGMGMLSLAILVVGSLAAGVIPASRALRIKAVDAIREE